MKTLKLLIITMVMINFNSNAQEFYLDTSELNWTGKAAFNSYTLTGKLATKEGYVNVVENKIMSMEIVVDMKSLSHENSDLKAHLRGSDFFEVNIYKTAIFKLTKPANIVDGKAILIGEMTIKNTTKEEVFEVNIDAENLTLTFSKVLDRTIYGVTFNSPNYFKKLKENAIADEFKLQGALTFK